MKPAVRKTEKILTNNVMESTPYDFIICCMLFIDEA